MLFGGVERAPELGIGAVEIDRILARRTPQGEDESDLVVGRGIQVGLGVVEQWILKNTRAVG